MADELTQPEARDDTYLEEVERALGVDETRLGEVRLLNQTQFGLKNPPSEDADDD